MHYEHEGMSLWYGTSDAPAPEGAVHVDTAVTATIAVKPADASNRVAVLYRVNQGPIETIAARWLQHDLSNKAQYFRVHFPAFRLGDTVEYTAVCHCAGRQVPDLAEAQQLRSSFHIVAAEPKSTSSSTVKEAHMHKAADTSDPGMSASSPGYVVPQPMPSPAEPLHAPASQTLMQNGTKQLALTQTPSAPMPRTVTGNEHKAALGALLATSPALAHPELPDKLLNLYAEHQRPMDEFWQKLPEHPDFKEPGKVEQLQLTLQLDAVTQHHLPLVNALQGLHQQGTLQSAHDLTKLDANGWTKLINSAGGGSVPPHIPGATQEEKVANYVSSITDTLQRAFPTSYVAQNIAKSPEIDLNLVRKLLARNPQINPAQPLPAQLDWRGIGETDQVKAKASMEVLRQEIKMFPAFDYTTVLANPVFHNPVRQAVSQFFDNAPDFEFRTTHIDTYLAEHGEIALSGVDPQHKAALPAQLKIMQRVFRVTPKPEAMSVLLGAGLHSAHAIASIPQSTFIKQFQDGLGGETQAQMVYAQAKHINALAMNTFVQVHQHLNDVSPMVIGSVDQATRDTIKQSPDWATLFGSLDFCDCEHCRSVYSPAAYFVDLLQFLNPPTPPTVIVNNQPVVGKKPIEVLFERRPDLQYIKLTCENTNTTLPYVDLVNEVLETYVAADYTKKTVDGQTLVKNTSPDDTSEGLSANPAYTNNDAYEALKQAFYPFTLPYNQPLDVVRTYLEHLGSSRYEVMRTFQKDTTPPEMAIACEYLAVAPEEYGILTGKDFNGNAVHPDKQLYEFYGYAEQDFYPAPLQLGSSGAAVKALQLKLNTAGANPALLANGNFDAATQTAVTAFQQGHNLTASGTVDSAAWTMLKAIKPDSWIVFLASVPELLKQAGIQYTDLLELLKTRFLNPAQALSLDTLAGTDPCDLNNVSIKNLDDVALDKLHRFIRLWHKTGWTIRDLDRVFFALGATDIDDPLLQKLALVKQLQAELNVPLVSLLSLWANIDADGGVLYDELYQVPARSEDSLYNRLFQNKAVRNPMDTDFALVPTQGKWELGIVTANPGNALISTHVSTILAALRITAADLAILTTTEVTDDVLNLSNLSMLYRFTVLARALKAFIKDFTLKDLFALMTLTGKNPFAPGDPSSTRIFVDIVNKVSKSGFSITQLNYIYQNLSEPNSGLAPSQKEVDLLFTSLRDGLKKIANDTTVAPDPTGDLLRRKLSVILDSKLVDIAMKIIDGSFPVSQADQAATFIDNHFAAFLNAAEAKTKLLAGSTLSLEERYAYVLTPLMAYLRVSLSKSFVKQSLSDALKLDIEMVRFLFNTVIQDEQFAAHLISSFLASIDGGLSATYYNNKDLQPTATPIHRVDPTINFTWPSGSPDPSMPDNTFSVEWTGKVLAQYSETYTFYTRTNNGVRLWINNQLLIDDWKDQPVTERSTSLALQAGQYYDLRMDYYNVSTPAVAELRWSSPSITKTIIPQSQLSPGGDMDASQAFHLGFTMLHKGAMLVNTFGMTLQEAIYFSSHSKDATGFDFQSLLVNLFGFTPSLFEPWERLADFFSLRNNLPQGEVRLIDVFETTTLADLKEKLHAATNWDSTMIDDLSSTNGFDLATIDTFKSFATLLQLQRCVNLSKRLGAPVLKLFAWAVNEPDPPQAQEIKNIVKAKYDNEQWLTVAKSLNDGLRENQRTALIAYLLQIQQIKDAGISNSSQLYEYFLIDVDMDACMLTSRIVQANATVQLFVQRCLMNLERREDNPALGVNPDAICADEWQWMKRYRMWEANRKVFLYPENWIEPGLRDNKTPFFKELETELLQNEITLDTAEQAFLNYLEKLDQVARLEICGMYWQEDPITSEDQRDWRNIYAPKPETNILHVFGRTFAIPHIYYYRQLLVNTGTWTPWEKVNVDIEGDHLIPIVFNRRLYIFWPIFTDKQNTPTTTGTTPQLPPKFLEIKLAWSEYKQNKWSTKQVSLDSEALHDNNDDPPVDRSLYTFKALVEDQQLKISVYEAFERGSGGGGGGHLQQRPVEDQQLKISVYEDIFGNPRLGLLSCIIGSFVIKDCRGRIAIDNIFNPNLCLMDLDEGDYYFMTLREPDTSTQFTLTYGEFVDQQNPTADEIQHLPIFGSTPSRYDLLYPHQYPQFALQAPFFYQDDQRTYFVSPEDLRFGPHPLQLNTILPPLNRATAASAITNNGSNAGHLPIFDHAALTTPKERTVAVITPAAPTIPNIPVGMTAVAQPITNERGRAMIQPTVVSGSAVSASGAATALPGTARKDLIIHPFGGDFPLPSTRFISFYHPHVCNFIKSLNQGGIPSLLTLDTQRLTNDIHSEKGSRDITRFELEYNPNSPIVSGQNSQYVDTPYPLEDVDFEYNGAYSLYNWELFFHIPMLIATRLSKNQRFAEAQQWFHYIFNPTDSSTDSGTQRYWKVLCFQSTVSERLQDLLKQVDDPSSSIHAQIEEWRHNPFNPHLIARMRLIAYQKNVVMKYIDNLIAWGDQLFQQDTMESINEATQLYILASEILGPRPELIPEQGTVEPLAYADVQWDSFANALVSLEDHIQAAGNLPPLGANESGNGSFSGSSLGSTFYYCIPKNDQLLGYWDTVADRLFKIRHCMNIEGVVRQLPLFAPPIDVSLLVQAAAMGVDLSSVLNDINAATPHYRFTYMLQKAMELCNDVKALGASLLAALEKKDAEALSILRASQETSLLRAVRDVKKQQLDEANANVDALKKALEIPKWREQHYLDLINNGLIEHEQVHLDKLKSANDQQGTVAGKEIEAQVSNMVPNFSFGADIGAPTATATTFSVSFGGPNIGAAASAYSRYLGIQVTQDTYESNSNGIMASFARRDEEWILQLGLAIREINQINKQIDAATIRASITQTELDNHDKQIENAQAVEDFLRDKYTNQDLYDWMVGQISAVYFQCYQMTYDIAKRAEQAFRFERGLTASNYITFGYWDSLKKGLLSGERLYLDLKRLEMAYIDQNKREYEITKHISLVLFDPMALIALKETGTCLVSLPEALFDMDYPGHYMRRIKSISLTIPCVTGPYTSINCTLTLQKNTIRMNTNLASDPTDPYSGPKDDDDAVARFITNFGAIESIATSTAQNDSGMFEVNFRDERYLPFEGAGVVSTWRIDMPQDCNAFDFETISDVIIKLNYTAREGGARLAKEAKKAAQLPKSPSQSTTTSDTHFPDQTNLTRLFSAKHEFSSEWYRFLHTVSTADRQRLPLDFSTDRFPFQFRGMTIQISQVDLFLKFKQKADIDPNVYQSATLKMYLLPPSWSNPDWQPDPNDPSVPPNRTLSSDSYQIPHATIKLDALQSSGSWALEILDQDIKGLPSVLQSSVTADTKTHYRLIPDTIEDIFIVCQYSASDKTKSH